MFYKTTSLAVITPSDHLIAWLSHPPLTILNTPAMFEPIWAALGGGMDWIFWTAGMLLDHQPHAPSPASTLYPESIRRDCVTAVRPECRVSHIVALCACQSLLLDRSTGLLTGLFLGWVPL